MRIMGWEMFNFRNIWRALFSWKTRFGIRPFALLSTKFTHASIVFRPTAIGFHYINNIIPCKSTMNEGSPLMLSVFKDQFVIAVCLILADKKISAISQTNCWFRFVLKGLISDLKRPLITFVKGAFFCETKLNVK